MVVLSASTVSKNMRKFRVAARMTQADLSVKLGVSQQTVSGIEKNRSEPSFLVAMKFCKLLKIYPTDLLKGGGEE